MNELISFHGVKGATGILAAQELRAALAICSGLSNKEIARSMECAPGTVKKTVERVFFKMGVSSRAALVTKAFHLGLISFVNVMTPNPNPGNRQEQDQHAGVLIA